MDMVEKMFQRTSSNELVGEALKVLKPNQKEKKKYVGIIMACGLLSICVAFSPNTVDIFFEVVQNINDIIVAMFGIIFTGYALFQALIGKEMLRRMVNSTIGSGKKEKSKLQEANELFAEVMILNFICVIGNIVLIIIGKCIPVDNVVFKAMWLNNSLAAFGIGVYFYIIALTLLEIKSFIYNIFQWFNFHAGTRLFEGMSEKTDEE